jgi:hypothetical protein
VSEAQTTRPRTRVRFREREVLRVIRAARKANIPIAAVDILPDGSIRLIPGSPEVVTTSSRNPFDE